MSILADCKPARLSTGVFGGRVKGGPSGEAFGAGVLLVLEVGHPTKQYISKARLASA